MQKNKFLIHLVYTLIAIAMIGFGMSLIIKANLGQSTVSGFTNALAHVINIKAGTVLIYFNLLCFVFELILLGKKVKPILILQPLLSLVFGNIVNFFLYDFSIFKKDSDFVVNFNYFLHNTLKSLLFFTLLYILGLTL